MRCYPRISASVNQKLHTSLVRAAVYRRFVTLHCVSGEGKTRPHILLSKFRERLEQVSAVVLFEVLQDPCHENARALDNRLTHHNGGILNDPSAIVVCFLIHYALFIP
jgi:hypothetical protein